MKKRKNSVYLVAKYLLNNKKSYIHNMKKVCKANNIGARVMQLRRTFEWKIESLLEGYKNGVAVYYYNVVEVGKMPNELI